MNEDVLDLMEEPADGHNHGSQLTTDPHVSAPYGARQALGTEDWRTAEFLREGGWTLVDVNLGGSRGGASAHRGVLASDQYVDAELLRELVASELGFTYEQIRSVYRQGGPRTAEQRELRTQIDSALLTLSRDGGNMSALAGALGLDDNVVKSALTRAK